ncbi:MAG TPA: FAD-binding oxidoreductase [Gemmatimonadaceae bacterium]|nr:FAD-binding oxidoreductase [Gemmatimonadaceae bacterium]
MPSTVPPIHTDLLSRAVYAEGAGIARAVPSAVTVARDAAEVEALVRWAAARGEPLIPRGSGSGMAGGAVGRGVILDVSRIADVGPVDAEHRRGWAGAGVVRAVVDGMARAHGLRFPVDPSSGAFCTVGGMAGTNAAGAHSLRYGPMRAWVTALDCVFDDGTRAVVRRGAPPPEVPAIRRFLAGARDAILAEPTRERRHVGVRKDSSGYALEDWARSGELVDLLVGSEGTLAVFVGVELALAPVPGATSSLLAEFPTLEQAVDAATRARLAGASACELLDRTFLDVAAQGAAAGVDADAGAGAEIDRDTESVLLVEVEGEDASAATAVARALERTFLDAGATRVRLALDPASERSLWELRHAASPILARLDPALKSMQFIEDGAVPPELLPRYVRGVREALASRGIRGVIFGHAGDANVHVNPLVDVRLPDWRERVRGVLDDVTALVARLGGTVAGEHGDGRLRAPLLERVWPERTMRLFRLVKDAFDPRGILNPGVKLPLPGQSPAEEIKYDPALPPLPAAARAALDLVERDRAYATLRLSLLERQ